MNDSSLRFIIWNDSLILENSSILSISSISPSAISSLWNGWFLFKAFYLFPTSDPPSEFSSLLEFAALIIYRTGSLLSLSSSWITETPWLWGIFILTPTDIGGFKRLLVWECSPNFLTKFRGWVELRPLFEYIIENYFSSFEFSSLLKYYKGYGCNEFPPALNKELSGFKGTSNAFSLKLCIPLTFWLSDTP